MYTYGVLLLELLTGLRVIDRSRSKGKHNLVDYAKPRLPHKRRLASVMDPKLGGKYPSEAAFRIGKLALKCLHSDLKLRPSMTEVVKSLEEIESAAR